MKYNVKYRELAKIEIFWVLMNRN